MQHIKKAYRIYTEIIWSFRGFNDNGRYRDFNLSEILILVILELFRTLATQNFRNG